MDNSFLDILADPLDGSPFTYEASTGALINVSGKSYAVLNKKVPLLRVQQQEDAFNYHEHYENDAKEFDYFADWHPVHREENRRLHQHILANVPANASIVLDVGCGGAWLAKELIPQGKRVVSMDISTTNPLRAVQLVSSPNHHGLVADVFSLPIRKDSIDCIVAAEIIEHVKDPALFIACLFNVLKPGGRLIVTTPYNETLQYSLCIHCNQRTPHHAHIHSFTEEKIKSMAPVAAKNATTKVFNSKLLVNLKLHLAAKRLPFKAWVAMDSLASAVSGGKALRLMMIVTK